MLNKIVKICGIILVGASLFAYVPFTIYAYTANVSTGAVTHVYPMNATFNGTVDTGGIPGNAYFEYGSDMSFGNSTSLNAYNFNTAYSGNFSTNITGLTASTTYYVRAVATNSYGKIYGNVVSFTTTFSNSGYNNSMSPTAITTGGVVVSSNTAQFNALVLTGNNNTANTYFEWGTTESLGNQTTVMPISGAPAIRHTNTITGLAPGTTYYFRAVVQNAYGTSYGTVLSLVTSGSAKNTNNGQNTGSTASISSTTPPTSPTAITSTDTTTVENNPTSFTSMLGATVFKSGSFLPGNLFGWLILIILILVLVLLGKKVHHQHLESKHK